MRSAAAAFALAASVSISGAASEPPTPIARGRTPSRQPCRRVTTRTNSASAMRAGTDQGHGQNRSRSGEMTRGSRNAETAKTAMATRG